MPNQRAKTVAAALALSTAAVVAAFALIDTGQSASAYRCAKIDDPRLGVCLPATSEEWQKLQPLIVKNCGTHKTKAQLCPLAFPKSNRCACCCATGQVTGDCSCSDQSEAVLCRYEVGGYDIDGGVPIACDPDGDGCKPWACGSVFKVPKDIDYEQHTPWGIANQEPPDAG